MNKLVKDKLKGLNIEQTQSYTTPKVMGNEQRNVIRDHNLHDQSFYTRKLKRM